MLLTGAELNPYLLEHGSPWKMNLSLNSFLLPFFGCPINNLIVFQGMSLQLKSLSHSWNYFVETFEKEQSLVMMMITGPRRYLWKRRNVVHRSIMFSSEWFLHKFCGFDDAKETIHVCLNCFVFNVNVTFLSFFFFWFVCLFRSFLWKGRRKKK